MIPGGEALYNRSIFDKFKNLNQRARSQAQASAQSNVLRGNQIAAQAGTAGSDQTRGAKASPYEQMIASRAKEYDTVSAPTVDVDVRRAQNNRPSTSTSSSNPSSSSSSVPAASTARSTVEQGDVFRLPTAEELELERQKVKISSQLRTAFENAELARQALLEEADADFYARERGARSRYDSYLRGLSGSGRGFSPRFTTAVRNAIRQDTNAEQAAGDRERVSSFAELVSKLRGVRDNALETLSQSELDALTKGSSLSSLEQFRADLRKRRGS